MVPAPLAKLAYLRDVAAEHAARLTSDLAENKATTFEDLAESVQTSLIAYLLDEVVITRTLAICERPHSERVEHLATEAMKKTDEFVMSFGNKPKKRQRYNRK